MRSGDWIKAGLVAAWLVLGGIGFLRSDLQEHTQLFFGILLVFPVLLASLFFGRKGGLLAALAASLACGSLALRAGLQSAHVMQALTLVVAFNAIALVTSWLTDRERESRRLYQGLFDNVPVGLYHSARSGRILEANRVMAQMLGYDDVDVLLTMNMADLYASPAERERHVAAFGDGSPVVEFETRYRRRDGGIIRVRNRCRAERDAGGNILNFHGSVEDITAWVTAAEEIRAVRARLENIVDFLPDATCVVDAERRVIAWNKAMESMTGVSKDEIVGRKDRDYALFFYGERCPVLYDLLWDGQAGIDSRHRQSVERHGEAVVSESFAPALHGGRGGHVWAIATPLYDAAGRMAGAIECVRDITARKEAEQALAESEMKYRGIVENASEGIFQATPDGLIIGANPALARILGYSSGQHMVDSLVDFRRLAADPLDPEADFLRRVWRVGEVRRGQVKLRRADGFLIWAQVSARAALDRRGAPYIEGFLQDVTAAKQAQELLSSSHETLERRVAERTLELEAANAQLRELDEVKSSFLSLASHELRTPLTSVLGFAKLIRKSFSAFFLPLAGEEGEIAARGRRILDNLDIILGEGDRLTRLVNDLLDLTKIESGALEWRDADLDLPHLLRKAVETLRGQVGSNPAVRLAADIPDRLPTVCADRDRIMQVLSNLLGNAAKFTAEGAISLQARAGKGWVEVRVSDTGPGIPEPDLENVFRKFFQVRDGDTLRDKPKGTGLGLTICRQVVEHYGGRIWAESPGGKGATFVFRLPTA